MFFLTPAQEIAAIFNGPPKRWSLFKENPRGALQRRNSAIWKTLQDPEKRARFHTLNNGLSIVCDKYEVGPQRDQVEITNMRIVNGCQTTVTLGQALAPSRGEPLLDDSVLVLVRVTQSSDSNFRKDIAEATNTQKQVTSADMASLTDEMRRYQELFGLLTPKYFLEIQAGNWDYMMSADDKAPYLTRIEREPLAQAVMAFKGHPGEALEDRRYTFIRKTTPDSKGWFEEIFGNNIPAEMMLLAWATYEKVQEALRQADLEPDNPLNNPDYTRYSALVRTWLVAVLMERHFGISFDSEHLPAPTARTLTNGLNTPDQSWFGTLYEVVDEAVFESMEYLTSA